MAGRRRTGIVLGLAVLLLAGAAVAGVLLFRAEHEPDPEPGDTWRDFQVTRSGLKIHAMRQPCEEVEALTVDESDGRVVVTLELVEGDGSCSGAALDLIRKVELSEPLRGRRVYDGACLVDGGSEQECRRTEAERGKRDA